ncbi:putative reverse transcriptase domain-containing protein [Tanacetum coccineum]|uniref:Reverse transcriptase domain-containing protein n=1 Tax=Tanacetum coccineum TaxID=301880 RepID=A0ABQ4YTH8_9ASTR
MPIELGSFDVIVGMDWLAKYHAVINCAEKIVRIPWGNETLIIHDDGNSTSENFLIELKPGAAPVVMRTLSIWLLTVMKEFVRATARAIRQGLYKT